jgi:hypothetical protein
MMVFMTSRRRTLRPKTISLSPNRERRETSGPQPFRKRRVKLQPNAVSAPVDKIPNRGRRGEW